ncbi:DUF928 domain-containing protein [Synechocystis sp. CACIAM 05]|uniref:DUF928 domain-containing protein n=1 Tax=Synechocystis sp. CACIAM 05 TaxID=1933929 RepID=UPI00138E63DE|nr:DUF928 domain-containing protein [Synechocystis sp. CACIAM 05]QHV01152.1 hypothetical protein BWK47_14095 [Synechocystis sp. CACIAM 05]
MAQKSGNITLIRFFLFLGLLGALLLPQDAVWANQKKTTTVQPKPVRWQPPAGVGASGRRTGNPPRTVLGGSRNNCAHNGDLPLTALIPQSYEGRVGFAPPTLYVYFPYDEQPSYPVRITVMTADKGAIYQSDFSAPGKVGLLPIALPEDLELTKNVVYRWRFEVQSVPLDYVEGNFSLEPEEIPAELLAELDQANPLEKLEFYLIFGWWYDALQQLSILKNNNQHNIFVDDFYLNLLQNENLKVLSYFETVV